jgi:hypothetical protein
MEVIQAGRGSSPILSEGNRFNYTREPAVCHALKVPPVLKVQFARAAISSSDQT